MFATLLLAAVAAANPLTAHEAAIDAGEVRIGPPLVRRFAFVNSGLTPLTITDVRSSCGCLVPTLAKRDYAPGECGELAVEVNTLSQPIGLHRWLFHLTYRSGNRDGEQAFELSAKLWQEVEVAPAAIAFRGTNPPPTTVTIIDRRPKPLRLIGVAASSKNLSTDITAAGIRVCVADDCPVGQHFETVTFTTDDPDYATMKLAVTVYREAKQPVTALPNRVTLVAGGSAIVQIKAADGAAPQIESIQSSSTALTSRWAAGPGDRTTVRIGLERSKWDGRPFSGEVKVQLKLPAGESIVIPVSVRSDE